MGEFGDGWAISRLNFFWNKNYNNYLKGQMFRSHVRSLIHLVALQKAEHSYWGGGAVLTGKIPKILIIIYTSNFINLTIFFTRL